MSINKRSEPPTAGAEQPVKKTKVTTESPETKQIEIMAEAARKSAIPSPASTRAQSDNKTPTQRSENKPVPPRPNSKTAEAAPIKQLTASEYLALRRMGAKADKIVCNRRKEAEDALCRLDGLAHDIKRITNMLKQHVKDCTSESTKLKQFLHAAEKGRVNNKDLRVLLTIASLSPDLGGNPEAEEAEAPEAKKSDSATSKAFTPRAHMPSNAPIARPRSGTHSQPAMGAGMKSFLKKNGFGRCAR